MGFLFPPPLPASSPDRCIRIRAQPREVMRQYKFICEDKPSDDFTCNWSQSRKATPSTGFLDLPAEIRDMVYRNTSDGLNRKGMKWIPPVADLHNRQDHEHEKDDTVAFDCTIMRTCRQLHYEFAERLYASPIHLGTTNYPQHHRFPLHAAYRPLVRKLFVVVFDRMHNQGCHKRGWRHILNISKSLLDACPNISVVRIGWDPKWHYDCGEGWTSLLGKGRGSRESHVRGSIKVIKNWTGRTKIPHQLELVMLHCEGNLRVPIAEVIRGLYPLEVVVLHGERSLDVPIYAAVQELRAGESKV